MREGDRERARALNGGGLPENNRQQNAKMPREACARAYETYCQPLGLAGHPTIKFTFVHPHIPQIPFTHVYRHQNINI